jgi:large-conductance mechanosensitive channel
MLDKLNIFNQANILNLKVHFLNFLSFFIGLFIVAVILYILIKTHHRFSEENTPFNPEQVVIERMIKPIF